MTVRLLIWLAAGFSYWLSIAFFIALASVAPCGLAPGAWCEEEGPSWLGMVLGALGPVGVLAIAAGLFALVLWSICRRKTGKR